MDGYEARTIAIEPGSSAAREMGLQSVYATGEWSLTALTDALEERGLTTVPTKKLTEKPLGRASVHPVVRKPVLRQSHHLAGHPIRRRPP